MEIWRVKLISTQVVVEVEVGVELGKNSLKCIRYMNISKLKYYHEQ